MAFSRLVFTVLLISVVCNASNVPAFLWGDIAAPNMKMNPLMPTTTPAFSDILSEELVNEPFTVIFIEKTLSIEDFSRRDDGKTSFPYLHANLGKSVYLPSVENAINAIKLLEDPTEMDLMTLTEEGLSGEIVPGTSKFRIIYLEDARVGESRPELLRRHNEFMEETMLTLQKQHGSVVGVYTGLNSSWGCAHSRSRRQAASATSDYILDGLRLYAKNIHLVDGDTTTVLKDPSSSSSEINTRNMTTTLNFSSSNLALYFKETGGYWFFESVTLDAGTANAEVLTPVEEVFALIGFAYRCAQNVTFSHGNQTKHLTFEDLKVQPVFYNTSDAAPVVFGDTFNCVGFFSAPIWSALFVVFILLSITFFGIMMMMDIRTMDRFDDPKGKTITINAE